ncbi:MAG: DsrE family protein [Clostridium sp.]|nr:DsrE family protein [Clostridium sp.]
MNVLFHIDENSKWKSVLDNVRNMIKACRESGEAFKIEVLSNGTAVISLKEQAAMNLKMIPEFIELSKEGAVFAACRNSLNKFAICQEDLIPFVEVVPSGVIEIAKKQEGGYAYIKP